MSGSRAAAGLGQVTLPPLERAPGSRACPCRFARRGGRGATTSARRDWLRPAGPTIALRKCVDLPEVRRTGTLIENGVRHDGRSVGPTRVYPGLTSHVSSTDLAWPLTQPLWTSQSYGPQEGGLNVNGFPGHDICFFVESVSHDDAGGPRMRRRCTMTSMVRRSLDRLGRSVCTRRWDARTGTKGESA
jgi:hypothetical protein